MKLSDLDNDALIRAFHYRQHLGVSIKLIADIFGFSPEDAEQAIEKGRHLCRTSPSTSEAQKTED